jgi:hypothetical protein
MTSMKEESLSLPQDRHLPHCKAGRIWGSLQRQISQELLNIGSKLEGESRSKLFLLTNVEQQIIIIISPTHLCATWRSNKGGSPRICCFDSTGPYKIAWRQMRKERRKKPVTIPLNLGKLGRDERWGCGFAWALWASDSLSEMMWDGRRRRRRL